MNDVKLGIGAIFSGSMRVLGGIVLPLSVLAGAVSGASTALQHRFFASGLHHLASIEIRDRVAGGMLLGGLAWLGSSLFIALVLVLAVRIRFPRPLALAVCSAVGIPSSAALIWILNRSTLMAPARSLPGVIENLALFALCVGVIAGGYLLLRRFEELLARTVPPRRAAVIGLSLAGIVLASVLAAPLAKPARSVERPWSVIVLLIDTLRPDHLGCYGYSRPTSPVIDAFAEGAVVFDQAVSQSSWTRSSVASLMTGRLPSDNGVLKWNSPLRRSETTLAEFLRDCGYQTQAFNANWTVSSRFGFAQGFESYRTESLAVAETITDRAIRWIERNGRRPYFLYLHYLDPHAPYDAPAPLKTQFAGEHRPELPNHYYPEILRGDVMVRNLSQEEGDYLRDLYDGEIRYVDGQIGRILRSLRESGTMNETIVILTSDHGEEFLEHGRLGHNITLYDEVLRIPLMIRIPGVSKSGRRVQTQVPLMGLGATILDALGVEPPAGFDAGSFLTEIDRESPPDVMEPVRSELAYSMTHPDFTWTLWQSVRTPSLKLVQRIDVRSGTSRSELFDLIDDPAEQSGISIDEGARDLLSTMTGHVPADDFLLRRVLQEGKQIALDEETRRQLKSLGYLQ